MRAILAALFFIIAWPFMRPPRRVAKVARKRSIAQSLLPALVVFNAIFLLHTGADIAVIFGGAGLPENLTYAEYAQRGAYPLAVVAMLAGGFAVLAFPDGARPGRLTACLACFWFVQTLGLVASSIYRLDLYVDAYGLTRLRVAAFIWMGLIATGLALIAFRIAARRPARWLIQANALALFLTLYGCCYVNFANLIATANVERALRQPAGSIQIDLPYLLNLGSHAAPAIERMLSASDQLTLNQSRMLRQRRQKYRLAFEAQTDWRAWSWRDHVLAERLARPLNAVAPLKDE